MNLMTKIALPVYAATVAAAAQTSWQPLDSITAAAVEHQKRVLGPAAQIEPARLDPRLQLPLCEDALQTSGLGQSTHSVAVRCTQPSWVIYVPVRSRQRQNVVVLRNNLASGSMPTAADLAIEERELGPNQMFFRDTSQISGRVLRRPLMAGSILSPDLLSAPTKVRRGDAVTLLGRAGGMEVRVQGRALADGQEGQSIQVQNISSGRIVGGTVRSEGLVEVPL